MPTDAAMRLSADLAAELCLQRARLPGKLGAFAEHLPALDVDRFLAEIAARADEPIRVAVLGGDRVPTAVPAGIELTVDATVANRWRNDDAARQGRRTINLVLGQVAKINSLRTSYPVVTAADLRLAAVDRAAALLATPERAAFWQAVAFDPLVFDTDVLALAGAVLDLAPRGRAAILEREPHLLHLIDLVPERALFETRGPTAAKRLLERNRALRERLKRLSDADRRRVAAVRADPQLGGALGAEAAIVLRYATTRDPADLGQLSFENVVRLFDDRPAPPEVLEDDEVVPPPAPQERVLGDELAVDLILAGDEGALAQAARRFSDVVQPGNDEDVGDEVSIGARPVVRRLRSGRSALESAVARLLTADHWGGVIDAPAAADTLAALQAVDADDAVVRPFVPVDEGQVREMISRAIARSIAEPALLEAWDALAAARGALLADLPALTDHPLIALAASPELRARAEQVTVAHADFLAAVRELAARLRARNSIDPAKRLLARSLCLDMLFVRSAEGLAAIAAPTHPLHLWRWLAVEELLREHRSDLQAIGEDVVRALVVDPPVSGPNILLSAHVAELALEQDAVFVGVGSMGALPVYGDPQTRVSARFGAKALAAIASNLVRVAGHARFGLKVALVDPPELADVVDVLANLATKDGRPVPVHVEVLWTKPPLTVSEEEHVEMDSVLATIEDGGGSFSLRREAVDLEAVTEHLAAAPVHLAVVFEPGRGSVFSVGVETPPALSPLVAPRVYQYDAFDDRFSVVVAADATRFGPYYEVMREAMAGRERVFFGRHTGASETQGALAELARHALWTVVVDQSLEPTFHLPGALRLDWRESGGRDVVTFSRHPGAVEDFIARVVEQGGLRPDAATVERTLAVMQGLGGNTILMPAGGSEGAPIDPRVAKGVLGTLAAARALGDLHPGSLTVSLDDRHSRRWILGSLDGDRRRGDLLCIRPGDDGVVVTAVEVKSHDDADGTISLAGGRATGRAAAQIDSTIARLRRILSAPEGALDRARREILQDQLYRAVATRSMTADERARHVEQLAQLFRDGPARVDGAIFKVRIASGQAAAHPGAPSLYQTQADHPLAVYSLIETEAGGTVAPAPAAPAAARADDALAAIPAQAPAALVEPAPDVAGAGDVDVLLGHSLDGGAVHWSPNAPDRPLMNFGMLVTGDPGSGKTQALRAVIDGVVEAGLPVCIFDFKNDYADPAFSGPLGLTVYDVNRGGLPFNPLALIADAHGEVQPIRQVHEISSILKRIFALGDQQVARLRRAMSAAFEGRGIAVRERHVMASLPAAPSFAEVVAILEHEGGNDTLLNRLAPLFDLGLFPSAEAAPTGFEGLISSQVVLDLHSLPNDQIKAALAELIIVQLHGYLVRGTQPRALRRLLVFDEAWRVKDSERLEELAREGRAFGIGIAVGTQYPRDVPEALSGSLETQLFLFNREADHQRAVVRALCGATTGMVAAQLARTVAVLQKHQAFVKNSQHAPYVLVNLVPHYMRQRA